MTLLDDMAATLTIIDREIPDQRDPICRWKRGHTLRVTLLCERIARGLGYDSTLVRACRLAGLWHDLGRFPQAVNHGSLNDAVCDHAHLSCEIIDRLSLAEGEEFGTAIREAVYVHNTVNAPAEGVAALIGRVLMDADKIDIMLAIANPAASSRTFLLFDREPITPAVLAQIVGGRMVDRDLVACSDDRCCHFLSWVFCLYSAEARRILKTKGYPRLILARMHDREAARQVAAVIDRVMAGW